MGNKNVLLVAFHYPPYGFGSGVHRAHKFSKFLPEYGWVPQVLTATPKAYDYVRDWNNNSQGISVTRAFALDTVRHLGYKGRHPGLLALPDRWISWAPSAIYFGLKLIKKYRPRIIWTTYPISTAHVIGMVLHKFTGIPWVADFRDPMIDPVHPTGTVKRWMFTRIQSTTVHNASVCCFTTEGSRKAYQSQFPELPGNRWKVINNGYDEEDFSGLAMRDALVRPVGKMMTLLHSGSVYKTHRDPSCFFSALRSLKEDGFLLENDVRIIFRAAGNDDFVRQLSEDHGISNMIKILPGIGHKEAICEMSKSDGLLIMQADDCNQQIPAKIYEYLRTFRPIFALTDHAGDTARLLNQVGIHSIAGLDNKNEITQGLREFIIMLRNGTAPTPDKEIVMGFSRKTHTKELAKLFDTIDSKTR